MRRQVKQFIGLTAFAGVCLALGMGLSYPWQARALQEKPVTLDGRGSDRMPPIAEVAEKLNPTVVSIRNTTFMKPRRRADMPDDMFHFFFGPQGPQQGPQRRPRGEDDVERMVGGGSGVVISADGEILTNHHVIDAPRESDSTEIQVKTSDGRSFKARVLGKDKELDIALLKIDAAHMPFAAFGDSDAARVGEWVVAIGNPLGLDHTVTAGILSAKGRTIFSGIQSFLQTDAAINLGNSGGPLLNLRGEIIGINTMIRADGQNIGFAVPANKIKRILADLRSGKPVKRGFLGVTPQELDKSFQESLGVKEGVVVGDLTPGQAADKAGVKRLDVITSVDGQKVNAPDELVSVISGRRAGETVKLGLVREGKPREISVPLGDRRELQNGESPGEDGEGRAPKEDGKGGKGETPSVNLEKAYGFRVEALTAAYRQENRIPADRRGVVVTYVSQRSEAAEKGLREGVIIVAVGSKDIENLSEFYAEVKKAGTKPLILLIRDPRGSQQITVAIPHR
ncbi:MAG: Do family serine endopeptidase [Acidobacteria bacterium]|nr:Do family serine endopeptidase [Acidobacteriota bacterium]